VWVVLLAYPTAHVAASAPCRQCFGGNMTEKIAMMLSCSRTKYSAFAVVHPAGTMDQPSKYALVINLKTAKSLGPEAPASCGFY